MVWYNWIDVTLLLSWKQIVTTSVRKIRIFQDFFQDNFLLFFQRTYIYILMAYRYTLMDVFLIFLFFSFFFIFIEIRY